MKKIYAAAAVLGISVATSSFAQSSVTLYGVVDTGVEYITHTSKGALARFPTISGGDLPSRWGLKGQEDLGGGLKSIFVLESGFTPMNGTSLQSGREFDRQSYVGLAGSWGQVTLGRQINMTIIGMSNADIMGPSAISMGSFDGYLSAARADNSIGYIGKLSNFTLGATYSLGRDTSAAGNCGTITGDAVACRAITAMLKYDATIWGTALIYDEQRGGPGAVPISVIPGAPAVTVANSGATDRRYQVNGYVMFGRVKVAGGWIHRQINGDIQKVHTDLTYLATSIPYAAWIFDVAASHISDHDLSANGTLVETRVNYILSKRTAVYALAGYMRNSGKNAIYSVSSSSLTPAVAAAGVGQEEIMVGIRHLF
jgi:predicted porin